MYHHDDDNKEGGGGLDSDRDSESSHSPRRASFISALRKNTIDKLTPHHSGSHYATTPQMEQVVLFCYWFCRIVDLCCYLPY
jgi:hypothetical protein